MAPVIVVGGGPVGLALGIDLAWRGIPCLLAEQGHGQIDQPRMDLVGIRTMEFCRRWGIVEDIRKAGYPQDYPQDFAYVTAATGYEMGRDRRPSMAEEAPPPFSPVKRERCPQNFFDPALLAALHRYPHVDIRMGYRLMDFEQDAEGVTAKFETADGSSHIERAHHLIGCDGAGSLVRRRLGIGMEGSNLLTSSVNILLRCPDLISRAGKGPLYRFVLIDGEGLWATMVAINGRDIWRLQILRGPEGRDLPDGYAEAMILRAFGADIPHEILSVVPWQRRELVAERYREGRVFLCGDAAHQMSPTGGFGMNTGIGEAVDLGWKLEATLKGWAGPDLLDSYQAERQPIARRNMREASGNLARMTSLQFPPAILAEGAEGDVARRTSGELVAQTMAREWNAIGIHIGYCYEDSPICVSDGTPAPEDSITQYRQRARPGARAPHAWLSHGVSTLDLFGRGFALLRLGPTPPTAEMLEHAFNDARVPLRRHDLPQPELLALYDAPLVLVRPDGHVAWRGWKTPEDSARIARTVSGNA